MSILVATSLRRGLFVLGLAALVPTAGAQPQRQRRGLPAPTESVIPSEPVVLPMQRFNRLPAVDATINGRGPFRLIVDTGAAGVVLKNSVAETLELPAPPGLPAGAAKVQLASPANEAIPAALVHIDTLVLQSAEFRGLWTVAAELPFGDGMDGVIGMNVFSKCLLTFDYPQERIELKRGELPQANGRDIIQYATPDMPGSHPVVSVEVAGGPLEFMIDTGMRGWFAMPAERATPLKVLAGPVAGPKALHVGGSMRHEAARLGTAFRLGAYTVERPLVFLKDGGSNHPAGSRPVLGTLFLENFAVTFDARNNRLRLARESTAPLTPPPLRELGLSLKRNGRQLEVWDVHPDSHAAALGFTEGDVVHEINGRSAAELYGTTAWYELLQSAGTVKLRYTPRGSEPARFAEVRVLQLLP